jgi:hypothetical protein
LGESLRYLVRSLQHRIRDALDAGDTGHADEFLLISVMLARAKEVGYDGRADDERPERPTMPNRTLQELLNVDEPAWPLVQSWLREAINPLEALPPSDPARGEALVATQVTTRSPMGAVIYETGGLLVDHGWLRLLGSGHSRLPRSLPGWNGGRS